jgi:hypothetical protein
MILEGRDMLKRTASSPQRPQSPFLPLSILLILPYPTKACITLVSTALGNIPSFSLCSCPIPVSPTTSPRSECRRSSTASVTLFSECSFFGITHNPGLPIMFLTPSTVHTVITCVHTVRFWHLAIPNDYKSVLPTRNLPWKKVPAPPEV